MFSIRIAELNIGIDNKYDYAERFCRGYIIESTEQKDFTVSVTESEIDAEIAASEVNASRGYAETICIYRAICDKVLREYDGLLFHSAVIEYEGRGYAFSAKSGTGKSTHIALWRKAFGESVGVVNGDKPLIRRKNGQFVAYGTPWCGKEGYGRNASVPLAAVCFLERGADNAISPMPAEDAVSRVFSQILFPSDLDGFDKTASFLDGMLKKVPCYRLSCNMNVDAAIVAYNGMKDRG